MKKVEILMQKKSPENTHYWGTDHCMADYQVIILPIRGLHFSVAMEKNCLGHRVLYLRKDDWAILISREIRKRNDLVCEQARNGASIAR